MKKFLLVMVVAVLALALVACGGSDTTTAAPGTSTEAPTSSTAAPGTSDTTAAPGTDDTTAAPGTDDTTAAPGTDDTTAAPGTDDTTEDNGGDDLPEGPIDLINDPDLYCIDQQGQGFCTFEQGFGFEGPALILIFNDGGGIYNELVLIDPENTDNNTNWTINNQFIWELTLEGKVIEVSGFSLVNNGTSGWVRLDCGKDFSFDDYTYEYNSNEGADVYGYTISLRILDTDKKPVYVADLTSNDWFGPYLHHKPASSNVIISENRNPAYGVIQETITPISGPGSTVGEDFTKLFDNKSLTKICTGNDEDAGAVVFKYDRAVTAVAMGIVNANDNASSNGRTVIKFDLYGSNDGTEWTLIYTADGNDADGNPIDKASCSTNFMERYYEFGDNSAEYNYYKFVPHNGEMWQASELYLFEEK